MANPESPPVATPAHREPAADLLITAVIGALWTGMPDLVRTRRGRLAGRLGLAAAAVTVVAPSAARLREARELERAAVRGGPGAESRRDRLIGGAIGLGAGLATLLATRQAMTVAAAMVTRVGVPRPRLCMGILLHGGYAGAVLLRRRLRASPLDGVRRGSPCERVSRRPRTVADRTGTE